MRVLVCGGRDFNDRQLLAQTLADLHLTKRIEVIIHGCAMGADTIAGWWARFAGVEELRFPADWRTHKKAAGPIRNTEMLREGRPDLVVAFHGGRGTADMVKKARASGVRVIEVAPSSLKSEPHEQKRG